MAIPGGYRFKIPFDDVFPQGCYVIGVKRAKNVSCNGESKDAVDPISGLPVWAVQVTDTSARVKNTGQVVKIAAPHAPDPLPAIPNTPFRPAIFDDMSAVPYVRDGWVAYTFGRSACVRRCRPIRARVSRRRSRLRLKRGDGGERVWRRPALCWVLAAVPIGIHGEAGQGDGAR